MLGSANRWYQSLRQIAKRSLVKAGFFPFGRIGSVRDYLAQRYIRGSGIEIGGLHRPLAVPLGAAVRYVDRIPVSEQRKHYPELTRFPLVRVDVLDDGERLERIPDESEDFVIANHFLEHCENPIGALENMLRTLHADGILYMAIPDKRYTFDRERPTTTFEHLLRDYREGPEWSRRGHYEEWVRIVGKVSDLEAVDRAIEDMLSTQNSIHFHVWTFDDIMELMLGLRGVVRSCFEVVAVHQGQDEVVVVLRKTPYSAPSQ